VIGLDEWSQKEGKRGTLSTEKKIKETSPPLGKTKLGGRGRNGVGQAKRKESRRGKRGCSRGGSEWYCAPLKRLFGEAADLKEDYELIRPKERGRGEREPVKGDPERKSRPRFSPANSQNFEKKKSV